MFTVFLRAAGAAVAIGAVLIVVAVQLDLGIGPTNLIGVVLLLLGVGGTSRATAGSGPVRPVVRRPRHWSGCR